MELTIEANEESFVIVHQHGGNEVTCKSRMDGAINPQRIRELTIEANEESFVIVLQHGRKVTCKGFIVVFHFFLFGFQVNS